MLDAVAGTGPDEIVVVVGHGAEAVRAALPGGVRAVVQEPQLGTGHAVMVALEAMGEVAGDTVLVVPGDTPLLRPETLQALVAALPGAPAALLTTVMPDPTGYGRVLRDGDQVVGIVEQRDATAEQRLITGGGRLDLRLRWSGPGAVPWPAWAGATTRGSTT